MLRSHWRWSLVLVTLAVIAILLAVASQFGQGQTDRLDPMYQQILEQEDYVLAHPHDRQARQKLVRLALSEAGRSLIVVGRGSIESWRPFVQARILAGRAARIDVYRWLAYHAVWQDQPDVDVGTVYGIVSLPGRQLFEGATPNGEAMISVQQFPYPLSVHNASRGLFAHAPPQVTTAAPAIPWRLLVTLRGHHGGVWSMAFSPDGSRLATGGRDHWVKLSDPRSGKLLATLHGHTSNVTALAFRPDGQLLASAGSGGLIRLWDANTGTLLSTLYGPTHWVTSLAFSPDGKWLVVGGSKHVELWDVAVQKLWLSARGHASRVETVAFSPDGKRIASGSRDRTVKLWDPVTGKPLITLQGHANAVGSVAFSPDGQRLASGSADQSVRLWDLNTGKLLHILKGHFPLASASLAFSPDGRLLASASPDEKVNLWDVHTGQIRTTLLGISLWVSAVAFSPDGTLLAAGDGDGSVKVWTSSS